ncbi:hypothetical protein GF322_03990 [Candidatus Dependentiae bacterium]|nr:hypothetical protein [Candidatus Dependentiae bacterium]
MNYLKNIFFACIISLTFINQLKPMAYQENKITSFAGIGNRSNMEDQYQIIENWNGEKITYLGVFDGHGGRHIAKYLKKYLHETILNIYKQNNDLIKAIKVGFNKINQAIQKLPRYKIGSGSCAIVAFILNDKIIIANCGDSRAVLYKNDPIVQLSNDHKPDSPTERERINKAGGKISERFFYESCNVWVPARLENFSVSRAFEYFNRDNIVQGLIYEPEITTYDLQGDEEFLILASDGIWDVLSNEETVNFVNENKNLKTNISELLYQNAMDKKTRDNCTNIIFRFK